MRRLKLYVFGLLTLLATLSMSYSVSAQQGVRSQKFTIAGAASAINLVNTAIAWHQLTWSVSGTASACTVALDTSSNGTTWTAGGAITGQTCTSNGSSAVVNVASNYVRVNMTALTISAGGSVTVTWDGWTSNPGGGGGSLAISTNSTPNSSQTALNFVTSTVNATGLTVTPSNPSGGNQKFEITGSVAAGAATPLGSYQFNNAGNLAGATRMLDCSQFAGADMGAKINACISAATTGSWINISNMTSPISTAVTVNKTLTVFCSGLSFSDSAGITISAANVTFGSPRESPCTDTKSGNVDQITVTGAGDTVQGLILVGAHTNTGNGVVPNGATNCKIDSMIISDEATAAIANTTSDCVVSNIRFLNTFSNGLTLTAFGYTKFTDSIFIRTDGNSSSSLIVIGSNSTVDASKITMTGNSSVAFNILTPLTAAAITCSNCLVSTFSQSRILAGSGWPAFEFTGKTLVLTDSTVQGGGANGNAINIGLSSIIKGNTISAKAGGDGISMATTTGTHVVANVIAIDIGSQTAKYGIRLAPDSFGNEIVDNEVSLSGVATGDDGGIIIKTSSTGHLGGNIVADNMVVGGNGDTHQVGFEFDNSVGGSGASFGSGNVYRHNVGVDLNRVIVRIDTANEMSNIYDNNVSYASANLYDSGGSNRDVVLQTSFGAGFAVLPVRGNGSFVNCSDCTSTIPTASGGTGSLVYNQQGMSIGLGNGPLFSTATPVTVSANTTAAQNLYFFSIPASTWSRVGAVVHLRLRGVYSTPLASTATINFKVNACNSDCSASPAVVTTIVNLTSTANPGSVTNNPFFLDAPIMTSVVSAADVEMSDTLAIGLGASPSSALSLFGNTDTAAIAIPGNGFFQVTVSFSSASASNSVTARQFYVELE